MIIPQAGYIIVKDRKQEQKAGLVKTTNVMHEDKFIADVMLTPEVCSFKVGDVVVYDGLRGTEFPKVDGIDDELVIIKERDVLAIIK
jgi:co-chaperonin GroES (HSP10)